MMWRHESLVISDVNRTEFNAVVAAIQSTDNEH
jgi:hypothetical protein